MSRRFEVVIDGIKYEVLGQNYGDAIIVAENQIPWGAKIESITDLNDEVVATDDKFKLSISFDDGRSDEIEITRVMYMNFNSKISEGYNTIVIELTNGEIYRIDAKSILSFTVKKIIN